MQKLTELLCNLSDICGVSGREESAAAFLLEQLAPYGAGYVTPLGSAVCTLRGPRDGESHLALVAHLDEIGFVVTYIEDSGFLKVASLGGFDRKLLLAAQVVVHTANGPIHGVVCSIPPHLQGEGDTALPKVEDVYIDIGMSAEAAKAAVSLGDTATMLSRARPLLGDRVSGKALDDRCCCAAVLRALELLADELPLSELDSGLSVVFSSMEELGGQGAKTAVYSLAPTQAIVLDVSHAHTPDAKPHLCGKLGEGPMIGVAPVLNTAMTQKLFELAGRHNIPHQTEVMGGRTGTDADVIATSRGGVRTALISVPQRYMHSPIEVISVQDIENSARLLALFVKSIACETGNVDFSEGGESNA